MTTEEVRELMQKEDLQAAVEELVELCRKRGAPDNVSVAAVRVE